MVPTDENKRKLRDITCEMKVAIRMAKDSYSGTMHSTLQQNPKEFWRRVKRNSRNKVAIPSLVIGDDIVNGDTEKAESFNQYFCSVFTPVIRNNESRQVSRSGIGEMDSINLSTRGIEVLLQGLNASKACGPDGLPNQSLQLCATSVAPYLKIIYNKSLEESSLPDDWKVGAIVPIYKSGPRSDVANYRPVSLTCVCCMVFEHILYTSVVAHINEHCLFNPAQHGFRKGLSCVTQLTEFTHDIVKALDHRLSVDCAFLDFQKAFDTVPHASLIEKLAVYNIHPQIIS